MGFMPDSCFDACLYDLCVEQGECLDREQADAILANLPADADAFVEAIRGVPRVSADQERWSALREIVVDWLFDEGKGRATKSGLPRLPPERS